LIVRDDLQAGQRDYLVLPQHTPFSIVICRAFVEI
jgi:hypothetical protein